MASESVLAHLAARFTTSEENLATEALGYVLSSSNLARSAMREFGSHFGDLGTDELFFRTQATGEKGEIPDLVGRDPSGTERLIVEAKFWASLTPNQPTTYLGRLPTDGRGMLLFIAPSVRFETLWPEIVRKAREVDGSLEQVKCEDHVRVGRFASGTTLALTSWTSIVSFLAKRLEIAGESVLAADLAQLLGLATRMDTSAFLPLTNAELSDALGRRIVQYCGLVNDVVARGLNEGLLTKKGTRAQGGEGWWGHYSQLGGAPCLIHFSSYRWGSKRATPFWLRLYGIKGKSALLLRPYLKELEIKDPPQLLQDGECLDIPLYAPTGQERELVLEALMAQLRSIRPMLETAVESVGPFENADTSAGAPLELT